MLGSKMKHKKLRRNILLYFFLALFSLTTLFPLLWMITTSLKSGDIIFEMPPRLWPDGLHWENYTRAIEEINFLVLFKNTAIITFLQLLSNVFVSAFVAYGFARFDFRWKNFWFMLMLSTIMIPGEVTLIPVFIAFSELGWSNSIKPLVIPVFLAARRCSFSY